MRFRTSAASLAVLACGLATGARADFIAVEADSSRLVGGLTFRFNGRAESDVLAGTLTGSFAGGATFDTYCIDLYHEIAVGANHYDVTASPIAGFAQSPPTGSGAPGGDGAGIGWLYQSGEARLAHESGRQAVIDGAGLQVALWKMAYDGASASPTSPLGLASGNFRFLDGDPGSDQHLVFAAAASFLAGYDGSESAAATFLKVTDHGPGGALYQDLVAPAFAPAMMPLTPVPEPTSLALAGVGLAAAAVFAIGRRARRESAPVG